MLRNKRFQRTIENFTCENCKFEVVGNGYTNHCPNCLWSKHVDVNPGDRAEKCLGLMMPVELENTGDVFYIMHKCKKCGHTKRNRAEKGDNFCELVKISNLDR